MKAKDFIKKFGINNAKQCILNCASIEDRWFMHNGYLISHDDFDDLKRLIESHELVGGDLEYTKKFYADCAFKSDKHLRELKKAIADVESCQ